MMINEFLDIKTRSLIKNLRKWLKLESKYLSDEDLLRVTKGSSHRKALEDTISISFI